MQIWPRRRGKRAVFIAGESCTGPITIANLVVARNGSDAIASYCCAEEDCRRRRTPESVRFLGRRVYAGLVVVLITTVIHGLKPGRVRRIRQALQIDSRTLKRWRQWWLESFVRSSFWKSARARFMPPLSERTLPLSLWLRFQLEGRDRLLAVLQFLRPITTPVAWNEFAM
jgi:hypothetical protein